MPMDFPDLRSLKITAKIHGFRRVGLQETEADFREALADHVHPKDTIESYEIRTGKGWDKWTDAEKKDILNRQGFNI